MILNPDLLGVTVSRTIFIGDVLWLSKLDGVALLVAYHISANHTPL